MKLLVLAVLVAVAAAAPHELAQNNEEWPQHASIHTTRIKRGSAGTGFAQGVASVLEQFRPPQQIPNDGKYTAPGYVHLPPDQYKAYQDKVNELHRQGKL